MSQVDAFRFLSRVSLLFAPDIQEGQQFVAYIDEDNSFTVQADNVLRAPGSGDNLTSAQVAEIQQRFTDLQNQADAFKSFCKNIQGLQTQIQTLSGSADESTDFDYSFIIGEILDIRSELSSLSHTVETLENEVYSQLVSQKYFDV